MKKAKALSRHQAHLTNRTLYEKGYKALGLAYQRLYPNEELLRFLGRHYFSLPFSKRGRCRILEVGSGSGANLWMIAREGFKAYGLDSSASGLEVCRRHLKKKWGVQAILTFGDFCKLPYEDRFFDAVFDIVSLQHTDLAHQQKAFDDIYRTLKPGGRFFTFHLGSGSSIFQPKRFKTLDRYTLKNIPIRRWPYSNIGWVSFPTGPLMRRMLRRSGFRKIEIESVTKSYLNRKQALEFLCVTAQK